MNKNIKKKKKGFTLIELVIVLAVLAIIAMIAIPNFTRVRNKALIDGDKRSAEQIEKITLMAIANGDITLDKGEQIFRILDGGSVKEGATGDGKATFEDFYREANGPQIPLPTGVEKSFKVTVKANG